ncbi:glycosyltransferase [Pseudaestuariivita rosea]|uniref:glycosyltransferase n=1 Tax=Pseudaestuariivita rosea TaxID=2763263 RepID=UPI001ABA25BB|nr:glycosyltransferase [Pseudaestuariivita rosea]
MQIYGHCRFSWFGVSDTGRQIDDLTAAQEKLWHPLRMAVRFQLFENLMLPSLLHQTDKDFQMRFLVSPEMPEVYRNRLEEVTRAHDFITIDVSPQRNIGKALAPVVSASTEDGSIPAVHFRLDDDDAVGSLYIEKLRSASARLEPGMFITFPKGFTGFVLEDKAMHVPRSKSLIAIGLAAVLGSDYRRTPLQVQHLKVGGRAPVFSDPTFHAFHHSVHGANNTKGYKTPVAVNSADSTLARRMMARHAYLNEGQVSTTELDEQIDTAFPGVSAVSIRQTLENTTRPEQLAEEYGFL